MVPEGGLLILKCETGETQQWRLAEAAISIGRWSGNDIVLNLREVSRQHAKVWQAGDRFLLEDCGSKNGTYLNGRRVVGVEPLHDGDEIHIPPSFTFTFVHSRAAASGPVLDRSRRLRLAIAERRVWIQGEELDPPLSPAQFALLALLAGQPGRAYSRDEIVEAVWPDVAGEGVSDAAIDALVRRLRSRLAEIDDRHQYISVVRGYGFKLALPD